MSLVVVFDAQALVKTQPSREAGWLLAQPVLTKILFCFWAFLAFSVLGFEQGGGGGEG